MSERKIVDWFTMNGKHVPIYEGESKQDAVNRSIVNDNEDKKSAQISKNKAQADNLNKDAKIKALKAEYENTKGLIAKARIQRKIDMLESNWQGTEEEYIAHKHKQAEEEKAKREKEYEERQQAERKAKEEKEAKKKAELERELATQPEHKVEQFKIVQATNPMNDDYHVGIRKPSDIKTWEEAIKNPDSFAWGDFSKEDAEKALKSGKIIIYSSYPIKNGVFVSTSYAQSEQYAGGKGKKVYSKVVPLEDVAWIDGDEGQFAKLRKG